MIGSSFALALIDLVGSLYWFVLQCMIRRLKTGLRRGIGPAANHLGDVNVRADTS